MPCSTLCQLIRLVFLYFDLKIRINFKLEVNESYLEEAYNDFILINP